MKEYVGFDVSKEETSFCVMDAAPAHTACKEKTRE